jgi:RNA ligase (TIGR02306 family)
MSTFSVKVYKANITNHPAADKIELCNIGDYQTIVRKGDYRTGDLVAYIPEQAIVPIPILRELNLEGSLAGKNKNRVKAIRLRGVLSQGLIYAARPDWQEGDDVTEVLGITKWEPPIPANLSGEVFNAGQERTLKYDIENVKHWPDILEENEEVVYTEKLHGTWCCMAVMPPKYKHPEYGNFFVTSKGLSGRGLAIKTNAEANENNLYVRLANHYEMENRIRFAFGNLIKDELDPQPVYVLGELFGSGVQDLGYGSNTSNDENIGFRIFDIFVGTPSKGHYLSDTNLEAYCKRLGIKRVPVIYRGPHSKQKMLELTNGVETVSGKSIHIREGLVARPCVERQHQKLGRVQLKSISADYLCRKGETTEHT